MQRHLIKDDAGALRSLLTKLAADPEIDLLLTTGGTGISTRDNTVPVVTQFITTPIPGFGELFRMLSYEQIGSGAMLSRALAGVIDNHSRRQLIFALPGSKHAVELAMTKLILPEIRHLVWELTR
jgi:molybdopterin adenylyltransferase